MALSSPVFAAVADPTRRRILEMLASAGASTATALAGRLDISRQAVAKHLQLLQEAGLAVSHRAGRETRFEARPDALADVTAWVDRIEREWHARLALLTASLAEDPAGSGSELGEGEPAGS